MGECLLYVNEDPCENNHSSDIVKMDKPRGADEASSSSNTDLNSKPYNSAQLVWQIKGQYHVQCSEDTDSCSTPLEDHRDVTMNKSSDSSVKGEITSDSGKIEQDSKDVDNGGNETVYQARQRSRRDWQLRKWQTRQVAKAFVDNTINCVLEDMGFVPLSAETEDIINDGNLEHQAVSMAILSHGLQRSDHDTINTSSHVDSSNSHSTFKNNRSPFPLVDGLSSLAKAESACESYLTNNQIGASCSFSSSDQLYQHGDLAVDVSSDIVSSEDRIIVSTESIRTDEHSKTHVIVQSHSSSFNPGGMFMQTQADCDVLSDSKRKANDKLPIKSCSCSLSHKLTSLQKETSLPPFHKRKGENIDENSKRCCHASSSSLMEPEHNHTALQTGSTEESVSIQYDKVSSFEHFDFMDAAVAVAIQKKGLSAMACLDYS